MTLSELLKKYMEKNNYTVYQIHRETGIPRQTIYNYINNNMEPRISSVAKLHECLRFSDADLLRLIKCEK